MRALPFDRMDAVVSLQVIEHLWDLAGFLQVFGTPCIPPPIVPPDGGEGTGTTAEDVTYDSWDPAHATQE